VSKTKRTLAPLPTWDEDVNPSTINNLEDISLSIDSHLCKAASSFIEIGNLLMQARNMFTSDRTFGQWRMSQTSVASSRTASAYMQVARKFNVHSLVPKVTYSVLQELASASEETIKEVEEKVDAGEKVTSKEVREMKKTSVDAPSAGPVAEGAAHAASRTRHADTRSEDEDGDERGPEEEYLMVALTSTEVNEIIDALHSVGSHLLAKKIEDEL